MNLMDRGETAAEVYKRIVEMRSVERRLAYIGARSEIAKCSRHSEHKCKLPGTDWLNTETACVTRSCSATSMAIHYLSMAIHYLEDLGLLRRMPGLPHIVRVLDEPRVNGWDEQPGEFD